METLRLKYGTTERIFATMSNSSGVPVTGLADVLLEIYRKSDGKYFDFSSSTFKSSSWTTRQGAMTELSASLSPGVYYYDFATTAHTSQFVEESFLMTVTSATASNDPLYGEVKVGGYVDQIGISGGVVQYGKGKGMTEMQIKGLAEQVWKVVLSNDKTAADTLLSKSEFNSAKDMVMMDMKPMMDKMDSIPVLIDRTDEIMSSIKDSIMKPKDYSKEIKAIGTKVDGLVMEVKPVVKDFSASVKVFQEKMKISAEEINSSMKTVSELQQGYTKLQTLMDEYGSKLSDQTDMDKRFDAMASALNKKSLDDVAQEIQKTQVEIKEYIRRVLVTVTATKFDILQELK